MKRLKKLSVMLLAIVLLCVPSIYAKELNITDFTTLTSEQLIEVGEQKNFYCVTTDRSFKPYVYTINGILYMADAYVSYLLGLTFENFTSSSGYDYNGYDTINGKENILNMNMSQRGAKFYGNYQLMSNPALRIKSNYFPLSDIVTGLGYDMTYDVITDTYIIAKQGETMPKFSTYPEKAITYQNGNKTKVIQTILVNETLCMSLIDLLEIADLGCYYHAVNTRYPAWEIYKDYLHPYRFHLENTVVSSDNTIASLTVAPFNYGIKGLYIPFAEILALFDYTVDYDETTEIISIQ